MTTGARTTSFSLGDRYDVEDGTVLLSGIQALVRIPFDRSRADRRAGLRTGVFVSGYQGSPLGGYDLALDREHALCDEHDVRLVPGVNEELAATAVWGSQQSGLGPLDGRDGVVGIWYGKAPGVDRCGDVFRHANLMGASPTGGVLVLAGDDPLSKSSTIPSASEVALSDAQMPVLFPGDVQEVVDLGFHAIAMSRISGLWVGMKIITNVADGFGTARVARDRVAPVNPVVHVDGAPWRYEQGGLALPPRNLADERDLVSGRLEAAKAYARANALNQVTRVGGTSPRLGIVAGGKAYRDVVQALAAVDLVGDAIDDAGIRLLRLGMIWPIEPEVVRAFARDVDEVLVVEEKRSFVEMQVRDALYDLVERPVVVGKRNERGAALVPADGELRTDRLVPVLEARLGVQGRPRQSITVGAPNAPSRRSVVRAPYFCSGCPHNRSTVVPDGSEAAGGIGCHTMAAMMDRSTVALTQMGGEGAEWIGRAPFTTRPHLFQNVGDGTFFHSGSMAVRACVAAGVNITFKLLYNGAVAMTGGQDVAGATDVPALTRLLEAEGVRRTIVCAEDPSRYPRRARWADHVDVWPRQRLDEAQRTLREVAGVTVIVYDSACAAEKRRARKRGRLPTPARRVVINEWVCEGCGDCGVKSNCLSVQPVETEFGRKTQIHQSSCNLDYTCLEGDCPSFVTVTETRRSRRRAARRRAGETTAREMPTPSGDLPEPERPEVTDVFGIYLTGVGGTGVVTVSQVLATAAVLDGLHVAGLDQTGLSQKGGPVASHVRLARAPVAGSNALGAAEADAYLGFDLLVAAEPRHLAVVRPGTRSVVSTSKVPTGSMVTDTGLSFPALDGLLAAIATRTERDDDVHLDTLALAEGLFGDHMLANVLLLGAAYQAGVVPIRSTSIERALELNGVAVERNVQAFRWGRQYVTDPAGVLAAADRRDVAPTPLALRTGATAHDVSDKTRARARALLAGVECAPELRRLLELRVAELVDYQSETLARDYLAFVREVDSAAATAVPGRTDLAEAVARNLFKLMAYKDEYEVARLSLRPDAGDAIAVRFPDGGKVRYMLQPPLLRALGMERKVALGRWFGVAFRALRAMRRLRGTPFDLFGRTRVRRTERALVGEYRAMVEATVASLSQENYEHALALAELPDIVRGYEDIKLQNVDRFRQEAAALRA